MNKQFLDNLAVRNRWPAWVALLAVLLVTGVTGRIIKEQSRQRDQMRFDAEVERTRLVLQERVRGCETTAIAMRGFVESSREAGAAEWGPFA